MSTRPFTNPDFGREVRVEQYGKEVRLIFVASDQACADALIENLLGQLRQGALNLTLLGKPTAEERVR